MEIFNMELDLAFISKSDKYYQRKFERERRKLRRIIKRMEKTSDKLDQMSSK